MSHAGHAVPLRSNWQRWILAGLIVATVGFGLWGQWLYEVEHDPEQVPSTSSLIYHSVQFLILHGAHLHEPVPWQLHVGRLLGALALFAVGLLAFAAFFRHEALLCWLRMPWQPGHVLVCGLGDLGLRLALDARRRRQFVVAIEKGAVSAVEQARQAGVLVIERDACNATVLQQAGVTRAAFLAVCCANDSTNVAITAFARELVEAGPARSSPLVCRLLLRDLSLRQSLADSHLLQPIKPSTSFRVNFRDLDLQDTAARQTLRLQPLDFQPIRAADCTQVHLVVVGVGAMGQTLALHAARLGHFANAGQPGCRLRITLIDADATEIQQWQQRYPKLADICEVAVKDADPLAPDFVNKLIAIITPSTEHPTLITVAFCLEQADRADDLNNLQLGLEFDRLAASDSLQTLIYQSTRCGFAALFVADDALPSSVSKEKPRPRIYPFGMWEDIFTWDVLLHESEDALASGLHNDYQEHH